MGNMLEKYRPAVWDDVKGQPQTVKVLSSQVMNKKAAPAYMLPSEFASYW